MLKDRIIKICDFIIEYGILAIVFFIPLIFDFTALTYNIVDLYKIIIFRSIVTLMLLAWLAKVFISGRLSYRGSAKIFWFALALLLSFFVSSFFSLDPQQSFWGDYSRQQGFYNYFNYLLFFVLLIFNIKNSKQIRQIIMAAICSAALASVYGLIQYLNFDPFSWAERASSNSRIFSTLGQPNFFGHYLILVLPLTFYALILVAKRFWSKFFIGLVLFMQLTCLVLTYSRAAWLGFIGAIVFLSLVMLVYKRRKKMAFSLIGFLLIGLIIVIGLNIVKPVDQKNLHNLNFINRLKSIADFSGGSSKMRLYYLKAAVQEINRISYGRLLIGFGPETLASVLRKYYRPEWGVYEAINGYPDRVHSWLFDQTLALGILGLGAILVFYIYLIYKAVIFLSSKQRFDADSWLLIFLASSLFAYLINNSFSFSLFTNYVYLFLILAMVWLVVNSGAREREIGIRLTIFSKILIWSSLLIVSAVFIYTNNINQIRAEFYYIKALDSMEPPACQKVVSDMEKTLSLSPNSSYYQENYIFLMLNCFSAIQDRDVRKQLLNSMFEHIKLIEDKESYGVLQNIARAYTLFGFYFDKSYYYQAEEIYNSLIKDFPYLTMAYDDLRKQKMWQEDYRGAIETSKRALEILPPLDHPDLNAIHRARIVNIAVRLDEGIGQAYFKMKNYDLALEFYKKGLALDPYRATLYKNIADVYYVQGRLTEAIAWNKRGLMLNPADYNWSLALSLLYRDKKDLLQAKEYLNQALKLAPENIELKKYYQELNK